MLATTGKFAAFKCSLLRWNWAKRSPGEPHRLCKKNSETGWKCFSGKRSVITRSSFSSRFDPGSSSSLTPPANQRPGKPWFGPAGVSVSLTLLWVQPIPPPLIFFDAVLLRTRTGARTLALLLCLLTTFKLSLKVRERTTARAGLSCAAFRTASFAS